VISAGFALDEPHYEVSVEQELVIPVRLPEARVGPLLYLNDSQACAGDADAEIGRHIRSAERDRHEPRHRALVDRCGCMGG
jgi:hypothetical protein